MHYLAPYTEYAEGPTGTHRKNSTQMSSEEVFSEAEPQRERETSRTGIPFVNDGSRGNIGVRKANVAFEISRAEGT